MSEIHVSDLTRAFRDGKIIVQLISKVSLLAEEDVSQRFYQVLQSGRQLDAPQLQRVIDFADEHLQARKRSYYVTFYLYY